MASGIDPNNIPVPTVPNSPLGGLAVDSVRKLVNASPTGVAGAKMSPAEAWLRGLGPGGPAASGYLGVQFRRLPPHIQTQVLADIAQATPGAAIGIILGAASGAGLPIVPGLGVIPSKADASEALDVVRQWAGGKGVGSSQDGMTPRPGTIGSPAPEAAPRIIPIAAPGVACAMAASTCVCI